MVHVSMSDWAHRGKHPHRHRVHSLSCLDRNAFCLSFFPCASACVSCLRAASRVLGVCPLYASCRIVYDRVGSTRTRTMLLSTSENRHHHSWDRRSRACRSDACFASSSCWKSVAVVPPFREKRGRQCPNHVRGSTTGCSPGASSSSSSLKPGFPLDRPLHTCVRRLSRPSYQATKSAIETSPRVKIATPSPESERPLLLRTAYSTVRYCSSSRYK